MKKISLKSQKGITLVMLITIIVILGILLSVSVTNLDIGTDIRNYNYMKADIELLEAKIMTYYNDNKSIPTTGDVIINPDLGGQESTRDNTRYYQIDITKRKILIYKLRLYYI